MVREVCNARDYLGLCFCNGSESVAFNPQYLSAKKIVQEESISMTGQRVCVKPIQLMLAMSIQCMMMDPSQIFSWLLTICTSPLAQDPPKHMPPAILPTMSVRTWPSQEMIVPRRVEPGSDLRVCRRLSASRPGLPLVSSSSQQTPQSSP